MSNKHKKLLIKLLMEIKENFDMKLFNFYKYVEKDFMQFYDENVNKFITSPEIFEWLGILDIRYVYDMFKDHKRKQEEESKGEK